MFAGRRPRGSRTRDTPLRPRRPTGRRARAKKAGDMTTTTITVSGMTCGHCVASVKEEIGALPGVSEVTVDLNAGGDSPVTITSADALDAADVRAAVDEAGYEVR